MQVFERFNQSHQTGAPPEDICARLSQAQLLLSSAGDYYVSEQSWVRVKPGLFTVLCRLVFLLTLIFNFVF